MVVRIRGRALPDGEYVDLYADGDRWTTDPVRNAELVAEGWLCGGAAAVAAGVDSIEHGMWLDPELLPRMAAQGTALTPTLSEMERTLPEVRRRPDNPRKRWYVGGAEAHGALVAAAAEAGVRVLAGTDSLPHGRIVDEVRALAGAGMRPHDALAAASWDARACLGLAGLEPGAPADAVVYAEDPRSDLNLLADPIAVVLRGRLVRGR